MSGPDITKVIVAAGVLLLPSAHAADIASAQQQATVPARGAASAGETAKAGSPGGTAIGTSGRVATPGTANGAGAASNAGAVNGAGTASANDTGAQGSGVGVTFTAPVIGADASATSAGAAVEQAGNSEAATGQTSGGGSAPADGRTGLAVGESGVGGESALPYLESDEQVFDMEGRSMTAAGNAVLRHGETSLKADSVEFRQREKLATARGDVVVADGPFRFIAPQASYAYESGTLSARDYRFGVYPLRVKGATLDGTKDDFETTDTTLYFNEPDLFALNLNAGSARLVDQQTLYLEDVVFRLGGIPFFYVPSYSVGLQSDVPVSFSFRIGYNRSLGAFAQTQTLLRLLEGVQLGANLDGYTARGVLVGPAARVNTTFGEDSFIDSSFSSGYINDNGGSGKLGVDILGRPIDRNRFFIDWDLIGGLGKRVDVTGTLNWWSDSEVTRDYREDIFNHDQTPDNFFATTYRGDQFLTSAFIRYQPNAWTQTAQRMPELSFNLVPTEILETGIYQRFEASYAHLEEKDPYGVFPEMRSNRLNGYYNLSRTFGYSDWMTVTPVAGVMVTHYGDTNPGSGQNSYTRVLGEVGLDAQMLMHGQWDVQNKAWGINGLRHQMRPVLQYRYIPAAQAGDTLIPQIDRQSAFQTYLDPVGLANRRSIDNLYASSTLRIGLENVLLTRSDTDYGSRQLVALNLYQQFNFIRQPEQLARYNQPATPRQDTFSDFYTQLAVTPASWLNWEVFTRLDPERFQMRQVSTRTRVLDADQWSAYVGNDYLEDNPGQMINQYVLGGAYRINDRNQLSIDFRIDGSLSEVTEQYYGWQTMLGNSWLVTTQIGYLQGSSRENHFQFRIRADLRLF